MKYLATWDNLTQAVLRLRDNLRDFQDYGVRVPAPGGGWAWGWIETERPVTPGLTALLGLVQAREMSLKDTLSNNQQ